MVNGRNSSEARTTQILKIIIKKILISSEDWMTKKEENLLLTPRKKFWRSWIVSKCQVLDHKILKLRWEKFLEPNRRILYEAGSKMNIFLYML